jgi:plastocyanin
VAPNARRIARLAGLVLTGAGLLISACGPEPDRSGANGAARDEVRPARASSGRIRGIVTLRGEAPPARTEANTKDPGTCGSSVPVTRLALGPNNTVRDAFVYLDGVPASEAPRARATTEIQQEHCEYGPHAMTVAPGAGLEIVNNDPVLHNVHARTATPDGLQTVFNIAQPIRGQRTKVESLLNTPGVVALTCEAGHPWMTAYILVAAHPYVATTNASGEFVIDQVPPGRYPIRMWHEGIRLTRIIPSLQQYEYEAPYEATEDVVVPENGEAVVNFALELRTLE